MTHQRLAFKIRRTRARHQATVDQTRSWKSFLPFRATALTLLLLVVIIAGSGVFAWNAIPHDPNTDSAEAGFLQDMLTHHAQAVQMATVISDRTRDPNLKALSRDISLTQSVEIGRMQGYLLSWDLPLVGDAKPMTWMGHPTDGLMPGMATPEQLSQLETLPVDQAEILFLQLMIRHHQGGVGMAQVVLERSGQKQVRLMADRIVIAQNSEIGTMNDMLRARGQQPITDPLPDDSMHMGT